MATPPTGEAPHRSFEDLVATIGRAHAELAVNRSLTLRNWLIGCYIVEYEQQGTDRARYGDKLVKRLSERLVQAGVSRAEARELRRYRLFYRTYPEIRESLTPGLAGALLSRTKGRGKRESSAPRSESLPAMS